MILSLSILKGRLFQILIIILLAFLAIRSFAIQHEYLQSQIPFLWRGAKIDQPRVDAIKEAFVFAFQEYWVTCKGHDEIKPVTRTCSDTRYVQSSKLPTLLH